MKVEKIAPLSLLLMVAGVALWVGTGDWKFGAYGALAFVAVAIVGASLTNRKDESK